MIPIGGVATVKAIHDRSITPVSIQWGILDQRI